MGEHWRQITWGARWAALLLVVMLSSSCLRYDLGIQFDHANHGQIVQQVQVNPRTAALAGPTLSAWLEDRDRQVRQLGGRAQRRGETVTFLLPFNDGDDLTERFNQLFASKQGLEIPQLGSVRSHLSLTQTNRLWAVRNHLIYDLDLRDLPAQSESPAGLSADWLNFHFQLQTPWGLSPATPDTPVPPAGGWQLQPGQRHHIDVVFWLPNWIGLGGSAIAGLVLLGYFLKYGGRRSRRQPPQTNR